MKAVIIAVNDFTKSSILKTILARKTIISLNNRNITHGMVPNGALSRCSIIMYCRPVSRQTARCRAVRCRDIALSFGLKANESFDLNRVTM
jgi:hypothetical protein